MEKVKDLIKLGDFFNSFQMLRINKETEYRTLTGGIVSIGVITTIIIAFASMIGETLHRSIIDFTFNEQKGQDPPLTVLKASPEQNFMLGVEVYGYNLSSENRIFDVVFLQFETNNSYTLPTQACTREHWAMLPNVVETFDTFNVGNWLCPAMNTQINLQGKYTSTLQQYFEVFLYPCNNNTDPSRPCASQQEIDQFVAEFNYFTLYYVNSVINADQPQYKTYYLQDRTYMSFNANNGGNINLYVTEIQIHSDVSIWPFEDNQIDTAISIPFAPFVDNLEPSTSAYATFSILKDYAVQTYERKVQKIFVVFSFMGGLIGAIMACLFMMNSYTGFAYELALAFSVFKEEKNFTNNKSVLQKSQFSIVHFLEYIIYSIAKKFKKNINSPRYDHIDECRNEIISQLDIKNLIKRIIFLEYSISFIFKDYQLEEMHKEKPTQPHQIKKLRKKMQSEPPKKELSINQEEITSKGLKPQTQNNQQVNIGEELKIPKPKKQSTHVRHVTFQDIRNISQKLVAKRQNEQKIIQQQAKKLRAKSSQNIRKPKDSGRGDNMTNRNILQVILAQNDQINSENTSQKESMQAFCFNKK